MGTDRRTLFVGNLSEEVVEDLLYELFLQAGPVESVRIPTAHGKQRNFGFVVFKNECSVPYSLALMHKTALYGRMLNLQARGCNQVPQVQMNVQQEVNDYRGHIKDRLGPRITGEEHCGSLRGINGMNRHHGDHMKPYKKPSRADKSSTPDGLIPPNLLDFGGSIHYPSQGSSSQDPYQKGYHRGAYRDRKRGNNYNPSSRSDNPKKGRNNDYGRRGQRYNQDRFDYSNPFQNPYCDNRKMRPYSY